MPTFGELVDEVQLSLEGFDATAGFATLKNTLYNVSTSITLSASRSTVSEDEQALGGSQVVEIGNELMLVRSGETKLTNPEPVGNYTVLRGFRGTPVEQHAPGSLIRIAPSIPRTNIKRAINEAINGLFPRVPVVRTVKFTTTGTKTRYNLPTDAQSVWSVSWLPNGNGDTWVPSKRWKFDVTGVVPDGVQIAGGMPAVDVFDVPVNRPVEVLYAGQASTFDMAASAETVPLLSTGLPDWTKDLVVLGACYRLAAFLDAARINGTTAEQKLVGNASPANQAQNLSKYFLGLYQQRMAEAEHRIQALYPATVHYTS